MSGIYEAETCFVRGLRYVPPYFAVSEVRAKGRWNGRTLRDIYEVEFPYVPLSVHEQALLEGRVKVNDQNVTLDTVISVKDRLRVLRHKHEMPVLNVPVPIIHQNEEFIIVNKPPSIPVHPTGRYMHNTITEILSKSLQKQIFPVHRLDRHTSGFLLLALTRSAACELSSLFVTQKIHKEYIARVHGLFPILPYPCVVTTRIVQVDKKHALFACTRDENEGVDAITMFRALKHFEDVNESLVLCTPRTGRTHQIRLHLQHCGFSIVGDPIYERRDCEMHIEQDMLLWNEKEQVFFLESDIDEKHSTSGRVRARRDAWTRSRDVKIEPRKDFTFTDDEVKKIRGDSVDPLCPDCMKDLPESLVMCLHAWKCRVSSPNNCPLDDGDIFSQCEATWPEWAEK